HRPTFKPILPMSQKYGGRINFGGPGMSPIRIRKISPKAPTGNSSLSSAGTMSQSLTTGGNKGASPSPGLVSPTLSDQKQQYPSQHQDSKPSITLGTMSNTSQCTSMSGTLSATSGTCESRNNSTTALLVSPGTSRN